MDYIKARGGQLHLRHRVTAVHHKDENGTTEVTGLTMGTPDGDVEVEADAYLAACAGIQRLLPEEWRRFEQFDNIYKLEAVPVATVQLRYDGWVTELGDQPQAAAARADVAHPAGLNNLLYTADADFSCFVDLALASPEDYRKGRPGLTAAVRAYPGRPLDPAQNRGDRRPHRCPGAQALPLQQRLGSWCGATWSSWPSRCTAKPPAWSLIGLISALR